jgi:hypothetical protein
MYKKNETVNEEEISLKNTIMEKKRKEIIETKSDYWKYIKDFLNEGSGK